MHGPPPTHRHGRPQVAPREPEAPARREGDHPAGGALQKQFRTPQKLHASHEREARGQVTAYLRRRADLATPPPPPPPPPLPPPPPPPPSSPRRFLPPRGGSARGRGEATTRVAERPPVSAPQPALGRRRNARAAWQGGGWVSLGGVEKYLPLGERSAGGRGGEGARQGSVSGPTAKGIGERLAA